VNSLLKTVARQRSDCDLNPGPSAPESSTLTTRLPSHPYVMAIRDKGAYAKLFNSGQQECGTAAYTQADSPRLISAIALLTILHYGVRRYSTPARKEGYCYERVCLSVDVKRVGLKSEAASSWP